MNNKLSMYLSVIPVDPQQREMTAAANACKVGCCHCCQHLANDQHRAANDTAAIKTATELDTSSEKKTPTPISVGGKSTISRLII